MQRKLIFSINNKAELSCHDASSLASVIMAVYAAIEEGLDVCGSARLGEGFPSPSNGSAHLPLRQRSQAATTLP